MKIKAKSKDCRMQIRVKLQYGEDADQRELDLLNQSCLRGFFKIQMVKKDLLEYTGPVGITMSERLRKTMSKHDFFYLMEHIVCMVKRLRNSRLNIHKVLLDMRYVYVNEATRETQFIYLPTVKPCRNNDIRAFMEAIIYSVHPMEEQDLQYIPRFLRFLNSMQSFDPDMTERYIRQEDPAVVAAFQHTSGAQSGFMTNKQRHYYEHYEKKYAYRTGSDQTTLLEDNAAGDYVDPYGDTGLMGENNAAVSADPYGDTSLMGENNAAVSADPYGDTDLMGENNASDYKAVYDDTDLMAVNSKQHHHKVQVPKQEEAKPEPVRREPIQIFRREPQPKQPSTPSVGWGAQDFDPYGTMPLDEEGSNETTLLVQPDGGRIHFASIKRVSNGETVSINKPVFRIGKERSYVDYFVANNNAVSRSHADIVTRGKKYFVIDLNSKNRTYINEQPIPIHCEVEIRNGDRLRLANEDFVFYT